MDMLQIFKIIKCHKNDRIIAPNLYNMDQLNMKKYKCNSEITHDFFEMDEFWLSSTPLSSSPSERVAGQAGFPITPSEG